jgi:hypothetical protein
MPSNPTDAVDAFRIARDWAFANNYPWVHDFTIMYDKRRWRICTNSSGLGCNLYVTVCARTGRVLNHAWNSE